MTAVFLPVEYFTMSDKARDSFNLYLSTLNDKQRQKKLDLLFKRLENFDSRDCEMLDYYPDFNGMSFIKEVQRRVGTVFEAAVFSNNKIRPDSYYYFPSKEMAVKHINQTVEAIIEDLERKQKEKQRQKQLQSKIKEVVKIGDVFGCSWGYDQTNVDYYQLTGFSGANTGIFRRIGCIVLETNFEAQHGKKIPLPNDFKGDSFSKRIKITQYLDGEPSASIRLSSYKVATLERRDDNGLFRPTIFSWGR